MTYQALMAVAVLVVLGGCGSDASRAEVDTPSGASASTAPGALRALRVGSTAPLRVYAHCGFEFTEIDGELWRTRLRDDGQGNPPDGWPQVVVGTIERTSANSAVFVGENVRVRAVFRPAPHATYTCA